MILIQYFTIIDQLRGRRFTQRSQLLQQLGHTMSPAGSAPGEIHGFDSLFRGLLGLEASIFVVCVAQVFLGVFEISLGLR